MADGQALRRRLVGELERRGAIRSAAVRAAFLSVPRELFVPEAATASGLEAVYRDEPIPTKFARPGIPISSSSQPAIMAEMLERLALAPGMRVLEIGAGTGYNAALLSQLVGQGGTVDTIDIDNDTVQRARRALRAGSYRVRVSVGDGRQGLAAHAPYDRIIVTGSSDVVPKSWFEQLAEAGIVEVPLRLREAAGADVITSLQKSSRGLRSVSNVCGGFMPLRGHDEPSRPPIMRALTATDLTSDRRQPLRHLSGAAVVGLSAAAKRRLLAASLEPPRRHSLGVRADAEALILYLSMTLPASRAITVLPDWGLGLISRDGRGLAYVSPRVLQKRRTINSLYAHGTEAAERQLRAAILAWDEGGRPGPAQLVIEVVYNGAQARLRSRWVR